MKEAFIVIIRHSWTVWDIVKILILNLQSIVYVCLSVSLAAVHLRRIFYTHAGWYDVIIIIKELFMRQCHCCRWWINPLAPHQQTRLLYVSICPPISTAFISVDLQFIQHRRPTYRDHGINSSSVTNNPHAEPIYTPPTKIFINAALCQFYCRYWGIGDWSVPTSI